MLNANVCVIQAPQLILFVLEFNFIAFNFTLNNFSVIAGLQVW